MKERTLDLTALDGTMIIEYPDKAGDRLTKREVAQIARFGLDVWPDLLEHAQSVHRDHRSMVVVPPIPMVLHCPMCRTRHVDRDEWVTRLHRTHLCLACKHEWRPANVYTVGVERLVE